MLFSAQSVQANDPLFIHEKYNLPGLHEHEGGNEVIFDNILLALVLTCSHGTSGHLYWLTMGYGPLKGYLRSMQGPDCQLWSPESTQHVCFLVQLCPLLIKTLERILSLPLLGGIHHELPKPDQEWCVQSALPKIQFARYQSVFSTPRAPHPTWFHTRSPKQLSLSPLWNQLLFMFPKNLSAAWNQDREMLHFAPPNPFFNPDLNNTLSSFVLFLNIWFFCLHMFLFSSHSFLLR